jgi:tetratricopeptide (TPR) repeat protein
MEVTAAQLDQTLAMPAYVQARGSNGRSEIVAVLDRADQLIAHSRYAEAVEVLGETPVPAVSSPELALRVLFAESWAQMYLGNLDRAVNVMERARALAEGPSFTEIDRAEAMFRFGCCRLKLGKTSNAISLFTSSLSLAEQGGLAGDRLARTGLPAPA